MTEAEILITIGAMMAGTLLSRYLPFILFPSGKKTPRYITYLGKLLPYAVMGLLTVYCLRNVSLTQYPHGMPEAIAIISIAVLHIWRKNTLLSIGVGTLIYMLLVQYIFI